MIELPSPTALRASASALRAAGDGYRTASGTASTVVAGLQSGEWMGASAAAFVAALRPEPAELSAARNALYSAAAALDSVANVVASASASHATLSRERDDLQVTLAPLQLLIDPRYRTLNEDILTLERQITVAMNAAADQLRRLAALATRAQQYNRAHSFWHRAGHTFIDGARDVGHFLGQAGKGLGSAVYAMAKLSFETNPFRLSIDPGAYLHDMTTLGRSMAALGKAFYEAPGATAYKLFDVNDLKHNPGRWIGSQAPLVAIGLATGGAGMSADAADGATAGLSAVDSGADAGAGSLTGIPPNSSITDSGYQFDTDGDGRVAKVSGDLQLGSGARNPRAAELVRNFGEPSDDAGHLIAAQFNGPGDVYNLVPQDSVLNRSGEWRALERDWVSQLNGGHSVHVEISPVFPTDAVRPASFDVTYSIDGTYFTRTIPNSVPAP